MQVTMADYSVDVGSEGRFDWFWTDFDNRAWEPATLDALDSLLSPGSRFVDIGAYIGATTLYAAARGAVVQAFEPDPVALRWLRRHLELNPELANRVTVHPYALSHVRGSQRLGSSELGNSKSTLRGGGDEGVDVEVRAIGDVAREPFFREVDVVKVDIEGGEFHLLGDLASVVRERGAALILSTHVNYIKWAQPPSRPALIRKVVFRTRSLLDHVRLLWAFRKVPHWYVEHAGRWRKVSLLGAAVILIRPLYPRNSEILLTTQQRGCARD
jgi:FkbM family methyltransferase